ncbi:hypothetical protein TCAL_06882 [Tigriopus californicus]|uniref:Cytoplasmic dynein 2 light intermediate chain 1 n=1 Tax=Tigriopus californicus TaxID=6832 RepID=A0A553PIC6_TIGCA|nr:cytoplasmic dynein 2 light intermediate chain 1-like isoform X2 [Tigriopus californicus]TRY77427.1 hypothetical protein TCAL_06882 [Tigriopus californicus]|eukprot:TCALIF_06882-PA protein Name:"Similar to dync2li1 Cytoplasmic dynein 2 light intermediate chain 1 (Danio rerio)" AED:0.28 eAED:0.28 QI:25/1/0.75/1/0.66/0.5/4/60/320
MAPTTENVWDAAIAFDKKRKEAQVLHGQAETTLLVIGSKSVGKSTLIHKFLERQEAAKSTLALEYTFGRKTNQSLIKDVSHIWELGGGTLFSKLLETPLAPSKLESVRVVVMVDLADPSQLWFTLESLITAVLSHIQISLKSAKGKEMDLGDKLKALSDPHIDGEHPDIAKNMEPEKKKIICRAMRFFAHYHGATLQFYTSKDSGSVKKARDLLSQLAFGTEPNKGVSQDYNKPLIIPAWSDSFAAIINEDTANMDMMKHHFTTHYPQSVNEGTALPDDPAKDPNFREPEIDQLRSQKDEDLERYRKDIEKRAKQMGDEF